MMRRLALMVLFVSQAALAADRHIYLNSTGGGTQLNDCPNPAHNAKGTSNTDELEYCVGGTSTGKVIGTASGRVTAGTCTGGGGVVTAVTNGVLADVDGDGTTERTYGSPQACIYNMAKSDSCEVHAGVYQIPGSQCNESCGSEATTSNTICDRHDCWFAAVFASGYFADGHTDGYGTQANPGYLRGAVMNSSTDTWDALGNKTPDTEEAITTYSPIFNLDANVGGGTTCTGANDGTCHEATACSGGVCTGDAYYGLRVGCGSPSFGLVSCPSSPKAGATLPLIDADANGSFETSVGGSGPRNTDWLTFKDIEVEYGNGGPATVAPSQGHRAAGGRINWGGNGNTDGARIDHIYMHNDFYSLTAPGGFETWWAEVQDAENQGCSDFMEVKNSYITSMNRWLLNDDCGVGAGGSACGCPKNVHDNRFVIAPSTTSQSHGFAYLKSVDSVGDVGATRPKQHRIWNNEIIFTTSNGNGWLWDLQGFGNSMTGQASYGHKCDGNTTGCGELWFYGNIVRLKGAAGLSRVHGASCGNGTGEWRFYSFNNTYDLERQDTFYRDIDYVCDATPGDATTKGKRIVEKNNVYYKAGRVHVTDAEKVSAATRANDICSETTAVQVGPDCTQVVGGRGVWWTTGTKDVAISAGLVNYRPKASGPMDNITTNTPCDPDADGAAGVDYNWDGVNDTIWTDIAGNSVNCPTSATAIDLGAIQTIDCTGDVCGNGIVCATGGGAGVHPEACDDGNTAVETACAYGSPTCTGCNADCSAVLNLTGTYCGDGILQAGNGEVCEAALGIGAHTCAADFSPCLSGTPACTACQLSIGTCTDCAGVLGPGTKGVIIK